MDSAAVVIAIDTNLLVYAHRRAVAEHDAARRAIEAACNSPRGWGIALAAMAEFYGIVTHPAASGRPSTPDEAVAFLQMLETRGGMAVWTPGPQFGTRLVQTAADLLVTGVRVFDLQIALCALDSGATELWTHDRNFVKVPGLRLRDPLAE